ncbi:MAG: undecaprenyldiphospho-muramoylpentapeptide beta-N-acetylglucosaminyltransferase [Chloroflexi bacterium]|nr:undecaprenyldiphospho-muramoylpentapeptide beta-N-acetylglucosaminyltransferase [Chloroflexota bacterium]
MHIVIAGGGSGGHVFPGLAVAAEMRRRHPEITVTWIATHRGLEFSLVEKTGLPVLPIRAGKLNRFLGKQLITDFLRIPLGCIDALRILRRIHAAAVLTCGGYVSVPVGLAARFLNIPFIALQQDVKPNLSNRIIAPFATYIAVAFSQSAQFFPKTRVRITGNPLRSSLFTGNPERLRAQFSLEQALPTILVLGGSQGAAAVNELLWKDLAQWLEFCQVLHSTGKSWIHRAGIIRQTLPERLAKRYVPLPFLDEEYADALALADIVISRAGAASLSELAVIGKCAILIPLPSSRSTSPQEANAHLLEMADAAVVFRQKELSPDLLRCAAQNLLNDPLRRERLRNNIQGFATVNGTLYVADLLTDLIHPQKIPKG